RIWYYVWTVTSVSFICFIIPMGVLLLPYSPSLAARRMRREKLAQVSSPTLGRRDTGSYAATRQRTSRDCRTNTVEAAPPRTQATNTSDYVTSADVNARTLLKMVDKQKHVSMLLNATKSATTLPPDNIDDDAHWKNLSEQQLCRQKFVPDKALEPRLAAADDREFLANEANLQFRELFCIFTTQYYRNNQPYHPKYIPVSFCTVIIVHDLTVVGTLAESRRPVMGQVYKEYLTNLHNWKQLLHRRSPIAIYLGVGGEWQDSARFSEALHDRMLLTHLANDLVNLVKVDQLSGLYIDWDRPRGRCGRDTDTEQLRTFVETLNRLGRSRNTSLPGLRLLLTVPPRHEHAKDYEMAARALSQFRDEFPAERNKFIYSVSVGPYTYKTPGAPELGATSTGHVIFDWPVRHKGRTTYDQVCKLDIVQQTTDRECAVAYAPSEKSGDLKVAAFAGPQQLWRRMAMSYEDDMGDTPIVVYDLDLDDFLNKCTPSVMSPLTEALAVGVL
ncbi:unnamed protein product, partial [Ixodes hexagonus]